eukprot:5820907-Prymnesium_polylepis.1
MAAGGASCLTSCLTCSRMPAAACSSVGIGSSAGQEAAKYAARTRSCSAPAAARSPSGRQPSSRA